MGALVDMRTYHSSVVRDAAYNDIFYSISPKIRLSNPEWDVLEIGADNPGMLCKILEDCGATLKSIKCVKYPDFDLLNIGMLNDSLYDCILLDHVFYTLPNPFLAVDNLRLMLRKGGIVIANNSFFYPIVADPQDCFRISVHGFRSLFRNWKILRLNSWGSIEFLKWAFSERADMLDSQYPNRVISGVAMDDVIETLSAHENDKYYPISVWIIAAKQDPPSFDFRSISSLTESEWVCLKTYSGRDSLPVLEIGTSRGGTSCSLAKEFPGKLFVTDDIEDRVEPGVILPQNVVRLFGPSTEAIALLATSGIKFSTVLIDGCHDAEYIKQEFTLLSAILARDCIVCFHDSILMDEIADQAGCAWDGYRAGVSDFLYVEGMSNLTRSLAGNWVIDYRVDSMTVLRKADG